MLFPNTFELYFKNPMDIYFIYTSQKYLRDQRDLLKPMTVPIDINLEGPERDNEISNT